MKIFNLFQNKMSLDFSVDSSSQKKELQVANKSLKKQVDKLTSQIARIESIVETRQKDKEETETLKKDNENLTTTLADLQKRANSLMKSIV